MDEIELLPWQLPWQQKAWNKFQQAFSQNKLHHAWIIEGDDEYAADVFIENLAQLVNCQRLNKDRPCKECNSCKQIKSGNYADIYKLAVLEKKVLIGVDQVREVNTALTKSSYSGGYRVVIVEHAELMNGSSANAFLKTLEEPGEKTLIILQTRYPSRLLATLRSRCQKITLTDCKLQDLNNWLLQIFPQKGEAINQALEAASYQPLLALQFLNNNQLQQRSETFNHISQLLKGDINLQHFEKQITIDHQQLLSWLEQYLLFQSRKEPSFKDKINLFYGVFQEIRLQSQRVRNADKPLLIREILIKWIALSANMSHS